MRLDADIRLSDFLCTGFERQDMLEGRIARGWGRWRNSTRPHGLIIDTIHGVVPGGLVKKDGQVLRIAGRISVFGEQDGDNRAARRPEDAIRPDRSYVAIVLFARPAPDAPVTAYSAYVHPCWTMEDLLLVDSNLERSTLFQLSRTRSWVHRYDNVSFTIEKPLFDIGNAQAGDGDLDEGGDEADPVAVAAPPVLLPDFIVHRHGHAEAGSTTVIVETMGYADTAYRERKARTVPAMSRALGGVPYVKHDFHYPSAKTQDERDLTFRGSLRSALVGRW